MCTSELVRSDPHSFHEAGQPLPVSIEATVTVFFEDQQFLVDQKITFDASGPVNLDFRGQKVWAVLSREDEADEESLLNDMPFTLSEEDPVLGSFLSFDVPATKTVWIQSTTSPDALGLQWLTPEQAGSAHPMLYSQFETINGRSAIVAPDAPGIRFTHRINLRVPKELRGLIAAGEFIERVEGEDDAVESWNMTTPVPLYLFAINVGDFVQHHYDDWTSVWADRNLIKKSTLALARTPEVMQTLESLFGSYLWGTYSTVVLPALGYPFGAMEHPCLTSMNAILVEDEYSATRVTIHEMTHSWFGNLITNKHWDDFWLNEGVTTFGELLAIRELLGEDAMLMQWASNLAELQKTIDIAMEEGKPEETCLKRDLEGQNPDDSFSRVPYYKGALFLWTVMEYVGEEAMLDFMRDYIATYRYTSVDTEEFLDFMGKKLGQYVLVAVEAETWVYEPGLPSNAPVFDCPRANDIITLAEGGLAPPSGNDWGFQEWELYLSKLSRSMSLLFFNILDEQFGDKIFESGILTFEFLRACVESEGVPIDWFKEPLEDFLRSYGRQVYLKPLYQGLCKRGECDLANQIFEKAKPGYHPIGRDQIQKILDKFVPVEA